jgi:hypothetical protein
MKRALVATILVAGLVMPVYADVTLKNSTSGKGMGMGGTNAGATYIKGNKMRTDAVIGDKTVSMIFDVDGQKLYSFDSKKKEADVWDMATFAQEITQNVNASATKASFKPNGQTKQIGGRAATGYDIDISMPTAMGGSKDMTMTVALQGPVWIVKGAPGSADYARFFRAALEKGWIFTNPAAAKAQPGQAKAMAEMYRQVVESGGIPFETTMDIKMGGSGPMAGLMAKMGNISIHTTVEAVDTGALSDDLFAPPAGYKLNIKK